MTKEKIRQFLERLLAAGEDGLENASLDSEEHDFARQLIHDGEAGILEVSKVEQGQEVAPKRQFIVGTYGAQELLYVARGWVRNTRDGLLLTQEGRRHLRLTLKPADEAG